MKKIKVMRYHWLTTVLLNNSYRRIAEIGVATGITVNHLLKHCPWISHYYAVDSWSKKHKAQWSMPKNDVEDVFKKRPCIKDPRLQILKGTSTKMAKRIPNRFLDLVFIDASHDYRSVKNDIKTWAPKISKGGMICGHDIHMPGVLRAVIETYPNYGVTYDNCWYCII
jgi:predicted O-methyltransferase YrrM